MNNRSILGPVALAAFGTAAILAIAQSPKPVMGSAVFDWTAIEVRTNANGSVRKFFESPTATLEMLECHVTTVKPRAASHAPHQHPDEEIIIVKEGDVEALINGEWKSAPAGSVIFFASNILHGVRNVGDTPAVYHVLRWTSSTTPKKQTEKPAEK
jgi:quercetin dioxygenase-like cupin family protein